MGLSPRWITFACTVAGRSDRALSKGTNWFARGTDGSGIQRRARRRIIRAPRLPCMQSRWKTAKCWSSCSGPFLSQILQELSRLVVEAGEYLIQRCASQMLVHRFSEDLAEVCGHGQVAAFVELGLIEAGPASINLAAF